MQPRSIVMGLSIAAFALLCFGQVHRPSEAEQMLTHPVPKAHKAHKVHTRPLAAVSRSAMPKPVTTALVQHQIQAGDTLFALAAHYNTKIENILQKNPDLNPENLVIGQVVQVPTNTIKKPKTRAQLAAVAAQMVINQSGAPSRYIKMFPCLLTAYSNSYESTGKHPGDFGYGITATGAPAKEGWTIAVDPRVIPLHSVVYIPGVGVRYAEDTGGAVKGAHIDVFVANDDIARRFGVKEPVNVYLIEKGTGESS